MQFLLKVNLYFTYKFWSIVYHHIRKNESTLSKSIHHRVTYHVLRGLVTPQPTAENRTQPRNKTSTDVVAALQCASRTHELALVRGQRTCHQSYWAVETVYRLNPPIIGCNVASGIDPHPHINTETLSRKHQQFHIGHCHCTMSGRILSWTQSCVCLVHGKPFLISMI